MSKLASRSTQARRRWHFATHFASLIYCLYARRRERKKHTIIWKTRSILFYQLGMRFGRKRLLIGILAACFTETCALKQNVRQQVRLRDVYSEVVGKHTIPMRANSISVCAFCLALITLIEVAFVVIATGSLERRKITLLVLISFNLN